MNEKPYRSPEATEAKPTTVPFWWKGRFGAAAFGLTASWCCFILCSMLLGVVSEFVGSAAVRERPSAHLLVSLGVVLFPCFAGAAAGSWFLRANERQKEIGYACLGGCAIGIVVLSCLLGWLFRGY